jgi:hypothetical protein
MFAKRLLKIIIFSLFVFAVCPFVSAESVRVGDTIKFVDIKKYIDHFSSIEMEKDEFETLNEYKNRINTEAEKVDLKGILIETSKDIEQLKYDVENQRFYFNSYFFGNSTYSFVSQSLKNSGKFEGSVSLDQVAYLSVGPSNTIPLGDYQAQNAMGASFTVQKKKAHRVLLVAYRDRNNRYKRDFPSVILLDEGQDPEEKYVTRKIAYLEMRREKAKIIKDNLKTGVMVDFVYPYYVNGKYKITPTFGNPNDVLVTSDNFLVSFKCGFITDPNGEVLKVVKTIQD